MYKNRIFFVSRFHCLVCQETIKKRTMEKVDDDDDEELAVDNEAIISKNEKKYYKQTLSEETAERNRQKDEEISSLIENLFTYAVIPSQIIQPNADHFTGKLHPFQLEGLTWMLAREKFSIPTPVDDYGKYDRLSFWKRLDPPNYSDNNTGVIISQKPVLDVPPTEPVKLLPGDVLGGILADEMGLGKTIQMLSLICK